MAIGKKKASRSISEPQRLTPIAKPPAGIFGPG
jgi:hypothetical protein